ncbi:MAG: arsenate reductase ArsC [Magnetococcales bacterium]|nr:arsenate reductase ArsC [Magnetococcales bacterium]MBF0114508.1 arsenate reductase ArsC [Magnetococcales bacterium]
MAGTTINVLFLCTHNSARSILAEALLNHLGAGRIRGYSAGSHPGGQVHPLALAVLQEWGLPTESLRSKNWDEFATPDAPPMQLVVTVCDQAAGEMCPIWPGGPLKAHWGVEEPGALAADMTDEAALAVFRRVGHKLRRRIVRFLELPLAEMDVAKLRTALNQIGQME